MSTESHADVVAMFLAWDRALFAGTVIPGALEVGSVESLDAMGRGPSWTCAAEHRSRTTCTVYGENGVSTLITVGDTLDLVTRQNGEEEGSYTVRSLVFDGTGAVTMQLEED